MKRLFSFLLVALSVLIAFGSLTACNGQDDAENGTEGLVIEASLGDQMTVTGYVGNENKVVIPKTYNGKKVVSISQSAFENNQTIVEVVIGENVTKIDEYAFKDCGNLEKIELPNGIINVGFTAFLNCEKLKHTTVGSLSYLGNEENPYLLLVRCEKTAKDVTINDNCKVIGVAAFEKCADLTSVKLAKKLNYISEYAFLETTSLKILNYFGTEEDWNEISLNERWKNGSNLLGVVAYGATIDLTQS